MHSVLLVGSGGREDALAWKLSQSSAVSNIWVLPGNDAMTRHVKVQRIVETATPEGILAVAQKKNPSLIMIGPEQPIVDGAADLLRAHGFAVCAPSAKAAQLEGSKIFSKHFMDEFAIPTAKSVSCDSYEQAVLALEEWDFSDGIVIKTDALAGGKGVVLCDTKEQASTVIHQFMRDPNIKVKTKRILFEEKLHGREVSAFALLSGSKVCSIGYACDYKRAFDGDKGPNTGGMGTYTPQGWPSQSHKQQISDIFSRVAKGMELRGHPYVGVLFAGLMIDGEDVNVIEFNIRFGDPETQVLMPTIDEDLFPLLQGAANGNLPNREVASKGCALHVVLASKGYPSIGEHPVHTGFPIQIQEDQNALLFFAGVREKDGVLCTSGGRVMGVTGRGNTLEEAKQEAYHNVPYVHFDGMHHRSDIGKQ